MAKKTARAKLKKKLDTIWSLAVRKKYPRCVMCGRNTGLSAHHAIKRKSQSDGVRWILDNGVSLCYDCHINKVHGQRSDKEWLDKYITVLNDLVPMERQQEICDIAHRINKFSIEDLREMVEKGIK